IVTKPAQKSHNPDRAYRSKYYECPAPAPGRNYVRSQRGGRGSADERGGKQGALDAAAFWNGKPARDYPCRIGKSPCFACSKQKSDEEQGEEASGGSGERREYRPPQDDASKHAS